MMRSAFLLLGVAFAGLVAAIDLKTCADSSHCVRNRHIAATNDPASSPYALDGSVWFNPTSGEFTGLVRNTETKTKLKFAVTLLKNDAARIVIDEHDGLHQRFHGTPEWVFKRGLPVAHDVKFQDSAAAVSFSLGANQIVITKLPFQITGSRNNVPVVEINSKGWFNFEQYRKKKLGEDWTEDLVANDWINKVNVTFTDSRPKGPASVAADVTFPGFEHIYGIPEHATRLDLEATRGDNALYSEPFRFFSTDTYQYPTNVTTSNYGAIPFLVAAKPGSAAGVMWLNPSETWIDIYRDNKEAASTTSHWMSESGVMDVLLSFGENALDVSRNQALLTGSQELPQRFALGYHQCRYSYMSQEDALEVNAGFDQRGIPYDVLWLDIDHTAGMRYFTWNYTRFPNPVEMQKTLAADGRQLVTIKDPHLAVDPGYKVYTGALEKEFLIKNVNGSAYEGQCWPTNIPVEQGKTLATWLDFTNPDAQKYWASQFRYDKYANQSKNVWTWNDMNEPAAFGGPDKSVPRDTLHHGKVEHRDIHNAYGMLMAKSSYEGHLLRDSGSQRPFVLTRSFFAGSQKYGAMWMGDSSSDYEHLDVAGPTIQSLALSGFQFTGGDIGGFVGEPDGQLLTRWYFAAIFTGFFRGHSDSSSGRREPWVRGEPYTSYIRNAIRTRYALLPFIYTSFWNNYVSPDPIVRPMFAVAPQDPKTYTLQDQYFFGSELLVKPITKPNVTRTSIYLADSEPYFNLFSYADKIQGVGKHTVPAPLNGLPVYIRGGSVIPMKRNANTGSSKTQESLPLSLVIAVSANKTASGAVYHDDGESFANQKGQFIWKKVDLAANKISSRDVLAGKTSVLTNGAGVVPFSPVNRFQRTNELKITEITLLGAGSAVKSASLRVVGKQACKISQAVPVVVDGSTLKLQISVKLSDDWDIILSQ
ncbi:glycosyl hydrolases family 31-domain-containing protein [Geranomyces variabilis]|nr:glycosyl hydrolases family 31-domain-containing protein [Geranomyces variabilis]KAJ3136276.1 hypothetical protein HDU90_003327 [Geranomyces variabilis]